MGLKDKAKAEVKKKAKKAVKKAALAVIKPFLPYIIIFFVLLFAFCTVIDAIFVDNVQRDETSMSEEEKSVRTECINKASYLNTCHNFLDGNPTTELLDVDGRETDKQIQWSHIYSLMAFHNMAYGNKLDTNLLEKVSKHFESTFKYETYKIKTQTKVIAQDEDGNQSEQVMETEQTVYLLIESDTIMGHYKYNYEEKTFEEGNSKTTKKVFVGEELIGEKYERLRKYLKNNLKVKDEDIETDVQVVVQASTGYYEGKENTAWLQDTSSSATIITNGKGLVPKGMFTWPIPGYTTVTSKFGMRVHPITKVYKLHTGTDVGAPMGANFVAMADGEVIKATYDNGYGNMVMINHGNGIVTLYAHGSEILVRSNQTVKKGEPVLKVGSTGYSTGPHAHFEVRINGNFANPMDYFEGGN